MKIRSVHAPTSQLRITPLLLLTLFAGVGAARVHASERWATLEAIHQLENPNNSRQPGRFGELGAYQFRSSTWRMHTAIPFVQAHDRETSDSIAIKHYEYLKRELQAARVPVTAYHIALAWNSGLSATIAGTSPRVAHNYASRASNIAVGLRARVATKPAAPAKTVAPVQVATATPVALKFDLAPKPEVTITPAPRPAHFIVLASLDDPPTVAFRLGGMPAEITGRLNLSALRGEMRVTSAD